jgi:hypothetical protein
MITVKRRFRFVQMKLILHGGGEDGIGSKREELSKSLIRKITPTIGMLQYLLCSIIII